ncbi:HNH endonuclease signature motif containing protein [Pseudomonas nunensis]|uniref:HNH endonuclease signature motif containing protein n=1 Tax=Pseudomonas nunensis TaxID=2961896 RepID=UPI0009EC8B1E
MVARWYCCGQGRAGVRQCNGGNGRYEIHHIEHIQHGGAVYDIGNLCVASPKRHIEIHKEDRQKL